MAKTLELNFNAEAGSAKVSVRNPKESLTRTEIKAANGSNHSSRCIFFEMMVSSLVRKVPE